MKDEYDFANGERGRFYRRGAVLAPPVHLDADAVEAKGVWDENRPGRETRPPMGGL
jgi:hypothetical protein